MQRDPVHARYIHCDSDRGAPASPVELEKDCSPVSCCPYISGEKCCANCNPKSVGNTSGHAFHDRQFASGRGVLFMLLGLCLLYPFLFLLLRSEAKNVDSGVPL